MNQREKEITELYIATLGRNPDKMGLDYWVNSNLTITQIAKSFFDQPEAKKLYPQGYNTKDFIKAVYNNLFNRTPDKNGLKYWYNELENGHISKNMFILSVIRGASKDDINILDNKVNSALSVIGDIYEQNTYQDISSQEIPQQTHTINKRDYARDTTDDTIYYIRDFKDDINKVFKTNDKLDTDDLYSESDDIKALLSGASCTKHVITYSFNKTIPQEYSENPKYTSGWRPFTEHEKMLTRQIFKDTEKFLNLSFVEVPSNGDIRFNHVDMDDSKDGFAKPPSPTQSMGGDVWISNYQPKEGDGPGTARYHTIIHEIGHALGLKHSFSGSPVLPYSKDDSNHTVMSYTYKGDEVLKLNYYIDSNGILHDSYGYHRIALPSTFETYDIEALQSIYGAKMYGTNDGDTVYKLSDMYKNHEHKVIWDTSGIDTIDLSDTDHSNYIDMRGGTFSSVNIHTLSEQINNAMNHFISEGVPKEITKKWADKVFINSPAHDRIFTGENTLSIVKGTVIENITTGLGDDTVTDNKYNNIIRLGNGNDSAIMGNGGLDHVYGGEGEDKVSFPFPSYQAEVKKLSDGKYIVDAAQSHDTVVILDNIELISFSDTDINLL